MGQIVSILVRPQTWRTIEWWRETQPERARKVEAVYCPSCEAHPGYYCMSKFGYVAEYHQARINVVYPPSFAGQMSKVYVPCEHVQIETWSTVKRTISEVGTTSETHGPADSSGFKRISRFRRKYPEQASIVEKTPCRSCLARAGYLCISVNGLVAFYHEARLADAEGRVEKVYIRSAKIIVSVPHLPVGEW